ncbi:MAG: nitroreductase family protein [Oligoflexus sp.]
MSQIEVLEAIASARRSVRIYDETIPVPDDVMQRAIDLAHLAPNSSNLQLWEFIRVRDPETKKQLARACLDQKAAQTSQEMLVVAARRDQWRLHAQMNANWVSKSNPQMESKYRQNWLNYYKKLMPFIYTSDPLGILGFCKWLFLTVIGFFRPIYREVLESDLRIIAHKSCALAAENFMLAIKAQGFDTCPMEGFDSWRAKRIVKLPWNSEITMIISVGKAGANGGVYSARYRIDRSETVRTI